MIVQLSYGKDKLDLSIPDKHFLQTLTPNEVQTDLMGVDEVVRALALDVGIIAEALQHPIMGDSPLTAGADDGHFLAVLRVAAQRCSVYGVIDSGVGIAGLVPEKERLAIWTGRVRGNAGDVHDLSGSLGNLSDAGGFACVFGLVPDRGAER